MDGYWEVGGFEADLEVYSPAGRPLLAPIQRASWIGWGGVRLGSTLPVASAAKPQ